MKTCAKCKKPILDNDAIKCIDTDPEEIIIVYYLHPKCNPMLADMAPE